MKDYTLEKNDDFILNYAIEDDYIYIKYASGKTFEKEYSRELEIYLLNQMKEQIKFYGEILTKEVDKRLVLNRLKLIFALLVFGLVNFTLPAIIVSDFLINLLIPITTFVCSFISINQIQKTMHYKDIINDYLKNINFLENIELFRNGISEDMGVYHTKVDEKTEQIILNLSKRIKKTANLEPELREPTLNTIDRIPDKSFEVIFESLKRDDEIKKGIAKTRKLTPNHK